MLRLNPKDNARVRYKIERLDDAGEGGWRLVELGPDGARSVFTFSDSGVLTGYERHEAGSDSDHPGATEEMRFDGGGGLIEWADWQYLPSDGLGWDFYKTKYDADGNIVDSEWPGQA